MQTFFQSNYEVNCNSSLPCLYIRRDVCQTCHHDHGIPGYHIRNFYFHGLRSPDLCILDYHNNLVKAGNKKKGRLIRLPVLITIYVLFSLL